MMIFPTVKKNAKSKNAIFNRGCYLLKSFLVIIIFIGIFISGCHSQDYDGETKEKAKEIAESFIINNYKDIETVEFEEVERSPRRAMNVNGTVNGDAGFSVSLYEDTLEVTSVSRKSGFPKRKEECKSGGCDY